MVDCESEIDSNLLAICGKLSEKEIDGFLTLLQSPVRQRLLRLLFELQESIDKSVVDFIKRGAEKDADDEVALPAMKEKCLCPRGRTREGIVIPDNAEHN